MCEKCYLTNFSHNVYKYIFILCKYRYYRKFLKFAQIFNQNRENIKSLHYIISQFRKMKARF